MLIIAPASPASPAARALMAALDAHLAALYPAAENFTELAPEEVSGGRGVFLVAQEDGAVVACGAVRFRDGTTAEVKRMWVRPESRGHGHARALLGELERWAADQGAQRLVLETGERQAEALGLYRSSGFTPIPCFGEYAASASSICMEKRLG
jgi:GNAT superfamily N-acetyltransferase